MLSHHYKEILYLFKCSRRFSRTLLAVFYKLINVISKIQESLGRLNNIFKKNTPIIESLEAISIRFIRLFSYVGYTFHLPFLINIISTFTCEGTKMAAL